jgi:cob(I)alamin adenosyltransferase
LWIIISQQRQIAVRDQRIKELSDQIVDQAQEVVPVLTKATRALEDTARALERKAEQ